MNIKQVFAIFVVFWSLCCIAQKEKEIVVFIASRNNIQFCGKNLSSVLGQDYENFRVIYVDDASDDGTREFVDSFCAAHPRGDRVTIIHNTERRGMVANQYSVVHELCSGHEIIVIVDGDDWLVDDQVLKYINQVYQAEDVWLTYGQFQMSSNGKRGWTCQMPDWVIEQNVFRKFQHIPSHLRTYYAWLFQLIKKEDLMYEDDFFQMTGDMATMVPMIEMARDHFKYIDRVLYVYNDTNPYSDHRISRELQRKLDLEIRSRAGYEPLSAAPAA